MLKEMVPRSWAAGSFEFVGSAATEVVSSFPFIWSMCTHVYVYVLHYWCCQYQEILKIKEHTRQSTHWTYWTAYASWKARIHEYRINLYFIQQTNNYMDWPLRHIRTFLKPPRLRQTMISLHCAPAVGSERAAPQPGQESIFPIVFV